uniref:THAP-type domain-containing protein n=1 Tax=Cyprinus carpio TaxID=7962 RepID=A0A8C1IJI6_CYPCA
MPKSCCVVSCTSNVFKNPGLKFIPLPCQIKQAERRMLWLQAIKREAPDGGLWDPKTPHTYVCGKHFITGSHVKEPLHPDFVPTIFPHRTVSDPNQKLNRYKHARKREQMSPLLKRKVAKMTAVSPDLPTILDEDHCPVDNDDADDVPDEMRESRNCLSSYSLEENDGKCRQMTGLSWTMFLSLFTFLNQFVKRRGYISLPPRDQLFITLIKLCQNPSFFFLSHVLKMPQTTVRQIFIRWLDLMYGKISILVHWPDRECFLMIPPEMKAQFPRLTAIIDCFEIRTEYPSNLKARAKSYSNYKKWTTVKYLIACSPSGSITFLSNGWGGRASDVHIVRQSGFLSSVYHSPGDQILADRGFTLQDDFALLGVELVTPSFTKGRKQLPGREVEMSRRKSNIRIHIERVIGVLKGRFHILDGPLPRCLV